MQTKFFAYFALFIVLIRFGYLFLINGYRGLFFGELYLVVKIRKYGIRLPGTGFYLSNFLARIIGFCYLLFGISIFIVIFLIITMLYLEAIDVLKKSI
jgi:hypothetical protein